MGNPKRILVVTGGGDCPGLNTVIRAIVKSAYSEDGWEVLGSIQAYDGILADPMDLVKLEPQDVAGIHVKGGTILGTTNKSDPFAYIVGVNNGIPETIDRSNELVQRLKDLNIHAVISIGGDGSQKISQKLLKKGVNIIGVPKTIDNDLYATELTFGFQTAVEIATDCVDKLVSTAESHNRVMIAEVMGRDAGWICLNTAIASGAEICLIPEIPYKIEKIIESLEKRFVNKKGFAVIVIAEGAYASGGKIVAQTSKEVGYKHPVLGGIGYELMKQIRERTELDARVTVLGHVQRGGSPVAFDRVLATQMGVKAFELVKNKTFGHMVAYHKTSCISVPIAEAISKYKHIEANHDLVVTARRIGICLGD